MSYCKTHDWIRQLTPCPSCQIEEIHGFLKKDRGRLRTALEKIADPRKRDHSEPDTYTTLGCVMQIAQDALDGK